MKIYILPKYITLLFIGFLIGATLCSLLQSQFFMDNKVDSLIVSLNSDEKGGILKISAKNTSRRELHTRLNTSSFSGVIYLIYDDGTCSKFVSNNYWQKIITGTGSGTNIRLQPGEDVRWSIRKDELVNLSKSKKSNSSNTVVAMFCWLDAANVDSDRHLNIVSATTIEGNQFEMFSK